MSVAVEAHDFEIPITSPAVLKDYLWMAFGVKIPDVQVCENHSTPWRAFCDAYFAWNPVTVWKASRGFGGKSFTLATLTMAEGTTLRADGNVLGGSGEQARRVLDHMAGLWAFEDAPRNLLATGVQREMRLTWGNKIQALMASQASVRGPHPQRLRVDEADEVKIEVLNAALGQPMSKDDKISGEKIKAQTVISSTQQYANGTMTEMIRRATAEGWPIHEWCYRETLQPHGWLDPLEVERKKKEVPATMWLTEYEGQEPSPGSRAIQPMAVERMFDKDLGEFEGAPNEYIEIEPPDRNGIYETGADWAKDLDWTIIITIRVDVNPGRVVAWERTARLDWPIMVGKFDKRVERYRGESRHDITGVGNVVNDYMRTKSTGIIMMGRQRSEILTRYITACEVGELVYPMIRFAYSEHKYASVEDVYAGGTHHLPDSISAGALAWVGWKGAGVQPQKVQANPLNRVFGDGRLRR